jgi:hypothetical protein
MSARGMRVHSPSTACATHAEVDAMIGRGISSVLKDRHPRRSEVAYVTHVSQNVFRH